MFGLLILCVFTHEAIANNITSAEVAEAYKYFESIHAKNKALKDAVNVNKVLPNTQPRRPQNLLTVLHEIDPPPSVPEIPPFETKPLQESRSREKNNEFNQSDANASNTENYTETNKSNVESADIDSSETNEENTKFKLLKKLLVKAKEYSKKRNHTTTTRESLKITPAEIRRMMEWFNNLFGKTTTSTTEANYIQLNVIPKQPTDPNNPAVITEILHKLNVVIDKLNQNLEYERLKANSTDAFYVLKLPVKSKLSPNDVHFRKKRDVGPVFNVTKNYTKIYESKNKNEREASTGYPNDVISKETSVHVSSFKSKILAHLVDSFNEIKYKIAPLAKFKESYSTSEAYKIGYIAASVDTLEENLNNVMREMDSNKNVWDENKIMEFFDKLKTSNRVLRTLMEYLESLSDSKHIFNVKELED